MSLQSRMKSMALARAAEQAAQSKAEACKRRSRRKSTALPGLLTFSNMRLAVPCTVADMSGSGARVSLSAPTLQSVGDLTNLPDRLTLVLRIDHLQVECEIVWRREGRLGLRFLGPPRPMPRTTR